MRGNEREPAGAIHAPRYFALRWALGFLALFAAIDAVVVAICPGFGGDCLYGFLTLIAYPVIVSGLVGAMVPRWAMRRTRDWRGRALISVGGALLLGGFVVLCHAIAIRLLNSFDYGGVLFRARLLGVGIGLSMTYYTALSLIAYAKSQNSPSGSQDT